MRQVKCEHGRLIEDSNRELALNKFQKYVKTDRNGTRYYSDCTCGRCGGSGFVPYNVDQGICWECNGSGWSKSHTIKVYTQEYADKLQAKADAKEEKKREEMLATADEANQKFFLYNGFNENGKTYCILGNTYDKKDELKALGAKWDNLLGWHMAEAPVGFETIEIDVDEEFFKDIYGRYYGMGDARRLRVGEEKASEKIKEANEALKARENASNPSKHYGEVGKRVKGLKLTYKGCKVWDNPYDYYGCTYLHKFMDESENVFIWKTSNCLEHIVDDEYKQIEEGETVELTATIKEHSEYNGIKQTVLTRCKVA